ncbi:hypothetical protein PtrM4_075160 [Pyrenophora tritici-repentis]|uniref:DUF7730 domain-containing protein n=1 Tax=Pyrenophora tritici-repentis TaxID=45151 RepID=A0A834RZC5_9PLEO|nr:hypothetical protein PtrM4_075160 [Pyrenophora tritici-repentis]KAI1509575.1 hypothetical protein Ptr86124_011655 [Pyrenophora tritici-repentis]
MTMAKLRDWIKKHFRSKPSPKKQSTDQPPFLPSPRRPITLVSFDTPTCLLFKLPYDILNIILTMAFGGRTFHVDIDRLEKTWQWSSTVCYEPVVRRQIYWTHLHISIWYDQCPTTFHKSKPKCRDHESVGIMGFLLSCRQAYTQGIDALYSTNTICTRSESLLLHLPKLIPTNRLASITKLDVFITAHCKQDDGGKLMWNVDHLKPILDNIATHCHQIHTLCLVILSQDQGDQINNGPALSWVDAFYRTMSLRKMRVDLPRRAYFKSRGCRVTWGRDLYHPREAPIKDAAYHRMKWRCLDSEEPWEQYRSVERYPYPPLKLPVPEDEDGSVESAGYWLAMGDEGPMWQPLVCVLI